MIYSCKIIDVYNTSLLCLIDNFESLNVSLKTNNINPISQTIIIKKQTIFDIENNNYNIDNNNNLLIVRDLLYIEKIRIKQYLTDNIRNYEQFMNECLYFPYFIYKPLKSYIINVNINTHLQRIPYIDYIIGKMYLTSLDIYDKNDMYSYVENISGNNNIKFEDKNVLVKFIDKLVYFLYKLALPIDIIDLIQSYSNGTEMNIYIKSLNSNGKRCLISVNWSTTIHQIKHRLYCIDGIPVDQLRIIFNGKLKNDTDTIRSINIKQGMTLLSAVMLRGN